MMFHTEVASTDASEHHPACDVAVTAAADTPFTRAASGGSSDCCRPLDAPGSAIAGSQRRSQRSRRKRNAVRREGQLATGKVRGTRSKSWQSRYTAIQLHSRTLQVVHGEFAKRMRSVAKSPVSAIHRGKGESHCSLRATDASTGEQSVTAVVRFRHSSDRRREVLRE